MIILSPRLFCLGESLFELFSVTFFEEAEVFGAINSSSLSSSEESESDNIIGKFSFLFFSDKLKEIFSL